jgi:hypothetical protein
MARSNQQNDAPDAPADHGPNSRGGHHNRSRGKGRGGYNGGNHGRQSGNYGPRSVPHANAASFEPLPPASWAMKYGRHSQPPPNYVPNAPGPWAQTVNTHVDPAMLQSSDAHRGQSVPLHPALHTSIPANTPIVTPSSDIATPTTRNMSSSTSARDNDETGALTQAGVIPGASETDVMKTTSLLPTAPTTTGTQKPSPAASHIQVPVLKREHNIVPISRESIAKEYVSHEGQVAATNAPHSTPTATIGILGYDKLMQLQVFNITLARKLQKELEGAKKSHELQEDEFRKKRGVILSLLLVARDTERSHEFDVQRHQDRFSYKMEEACKLHGAAKNTAQLDAIVYLKDATDFSRMAMEQREKIEKYRHNLSDLDNARAVSQRKYSDAVHQVLMIALGIGAVQKHVNKEALPASSGTGNTATVSIKSSIDKTRAQENRKDGGAAPRPIPQEPVFERQPQSLHQNTGEMPQRSKTSGERGQSVTSMGHSHDKSGKDIHLKTQFAQSPATVKNAIARTLNIGVEDWIPEPLRHLVPKPDDMMVVAPEETQKDDTKGKASAKQEVAGDKADNIVHSQPAVPEVQGKGKGKGKNKATFPAGSTYHFKSTGGRGAGRRKIHNKDHKDFKGWGSVGDSMAHAAPRAGSATGPPSGDMRKGG